jgi:hypothetical protein
MAKILSLSAEQSFEIADSFAQMSGKVLDFRISKSTALKPKESSALEKAEDNLDHLVVLFRANGIQLLGSEAKDAIAELSSAIIIAKKKITKIAKIKKAIEIATSVVELAVAILAKDPKAILIAAKAVQAVV